jgi:polyhydroxyalkanoate synthesis regulator phasin
VSTPRRKTTTRRARPASRRTTARRRNTAPRIVVDAGSAAMDSGRKLWLAGLGLAGSTFETATDAFEALVRKGRVEEPKAKAAANKALRGARKRATELVADATHMSKQKINEALDALGVDNRPRQKNLFHRLGDLTEALL